VFRYVGGALDGMLAKIKCPTTGEHPRPMAFSTRKSCFALNVQATADTRRVFTFASIDVPGAEHDSTAVQFSELYKALCSKNWPAMYYLLGDAAYKSIPHVLTPFEGEQTSEQAAFSFYHSQLRMAIECAFGILVKRWGVLWRPLVSSLKSNIETVMCCMVLHNICTLARADIEDIRPPAGRNSVRMEDRPALDEYDRLVDQNCVVDIPPDSRIDAPGMSEIRDAIMREMAQLEMRVPRTSRQLQV